MLSEQKKLSSSPPAVSNQNLRRPIFKKTHETVKKLMSEKEGLTVASNNTVFDRSLHYAIRVGNLVRVKELILKGANVNNSRRNYWTPLHVAAKHGHYEIMEILIEHGASVNPRLAESIGSRYSPFQLAVSHNHLKCAEYLLKNGANIHPEAEGVFHPILIAVFKGHVQMAALLLDHGADINLRFDNHFFQVSTHSMLTNLWKDHNLPLLHCSILKKFQDMTKLLLDRGADITLKTSLDKTTLMQAVEVNNFKLVKFLLGRGAGVNDRDAYGQPVLHFIAINANTRASMYSKEEHNFDVHKTEVLEYLIDYGADVDARFPRNKDHSSLIHYLIKYGFYMEVDFLLNNSNFNWKDIDLSTVYSGKLVENNVTSDIEDDFDYLADLEEDFEIITYAIIKWAISRQMIGLPINKEIILDRPIHNWISLQEYTEEINKFKTEVTEQMNYLKKATIDGSKFSLWHLLTCGTDELVKLTSHRNIKSWNYLREDRDSNELYNLIKECKSKGHKYFITILENRLSEADEKRILLARATEVMCKLCLTHLSFDCCRIIVEYLDTKELRVIDCLDNC